MKLILQNVNSASVKVLSDNNDIVKYELISKWTLIYFGVSKNTTDLDMEQAKNRIDRFVLKFENMRCFKNKDGRLDASLKDLSGEILLISNFTLFAGNKKWTKMDFSASGEYEKAQKIYDYFEQKLWEKFVVKSGIFGAMMQVESVNDGPVNYILEI